MTAEEEQSIDDPFALYEKQIQNIQQPKKTSVEQKKSGKGKGKEQEADENEDEDEDEDDAFDDEDLFQDSVTALFLVDTKSLANTNEKKRKDWLKATISAIAGALECDPSDIEFESIRRVVNSSDKKARDDANSDKSGESDPKPTGETKSQKQDGKVQLALFLRISCKDREKLVADLKNFKPLKYSKGTKFESSVICKGMKEPTRSRGDCSCCGSTSLIVMVLFLAFLLFMKSQQEFLSPEGMDIQSPPTMDYYKILGVPNTAASSKIKSAYRKLARKYHPDKNPNCANCEARMHEISEAYAVLSDKSRRELYDSVEMNFKPLPSESIDIGTDNFGELIEGSEPGMLWIVQIYAEWNRGCISFSSAWEQVVQSLDDTQGVRFGRIHAKHQEVLTKKLSVAVRMLPMVLSFSDGELIRSASFQGDNRRNVKELKQFIYSHFSQEVSTVRSDEALQFLAPTTGFEGRILIVSKHLQARPSRYVKHLQNHFKGVLTIAQTDFGSQEEQLKFLASNFKHPPKLPCILWSKPGGGFQVVENVKAKSLKKTIYDNIFRQFAPSLTPSVFNFRCLDMASDEHTGCFLRLKKDSDDSNEAAEEFNHIMIQGSKTSPKLQFGILEISHHPEFNTISADCKSAADYVQICKDSFTFFRKGTSAGKVLKYIGGEDTLDEDIVACKSEGKRMRHFHQSPFFLGLTTFEFGLFISIVIVVVTSSQFFQFQWSSFLQGLAMVLLAISALGGLFSFRNYSM